MLCEEKLLTSLVQLQEDKKQIEIKEEKKPIKVELELEVTGKAEDDSMSDHDYSDMDTMVSIQREPSSEDIKKKTKTRSIKQDKVTPRTKLSTVKRKSSRIKSKKIAVNKVKRENGTEKKPIDIHKMLDLIMKSNSEKDKSLLNAVTIVENSYACPFNAFFNNYLCIYCRQKFVDPDKLREHTMTHDIRKYKGILENFRRRNNKCQIDFYRIDCRLCDEKISDLNTFQTHITQVHDKKFYSNTSEDDIIILKYCLTNENIKCMECNDVFTTFHPLRLHMAEHFGTCVCHICGTHYFEDRCLKAHLKSHKPSEGIYTCPQCGKTFKCKYNMTIHIARFHTKEDVFLCTQCDESFFSNALRHKHMIEVHKEDFLFKCKDCDKVYQSRKQLREHTRSAHLKIFKHLCHVCDRRFYLPGQLKEHMTIHTGERNFRCEHCAKSYPRLKALKVHMQSHSAEKKYKCGLCSASYSQNVCLKNHVKRQHPTLHMEDSYQ
ncbi:gastrula zinc finger protein XlCGF46.1-like isoform X2 [Maniola hyperantus]|uniref:gastrula zinc finger protein XlCGF46.1-like isoform X2 n=1 Tax=Aphantopus hyperantus TaxID=2795564 RepID=UPI003747CAB9